MPRKMRLREAMAKAKEKMTKETTPTLRPGQVVGEEKNKVAIKMIIKTDTAGSLEALEKELMKLKDEEIAIELLKGGVGNINEDDARFSSACPTGQADFKKDGYFGI